MNARRWSIATVVMLLGLAAAIHYHDQLPRWPGAGVAPVQRVLVEGPFDRVSTTEVENAVLPYLTGGFFTVDLDAIRAAAESLPWVRTAQTMREWPDRVRIVVTEERAVLRWGASGLLNRDGELFVTGVEASPAGLPRLDGPPGTERDLAGTWVSLHARLGDCAARGVARLELDARRALRVTLEDGLVLQLGRTRTDARVERFCTVVVPALSGRIDEAAYVDLRYTNGFAVGWRREADAASTS